MISFGDNDERLCGLGWMTDRRQPFRQIFSKSPETSSWHKPIDGRRRGPAHPPKPAPPSPSGFIAPASRQPKAAWMRRLLRERLRQERLLLSLRCRRGGRTRPGGFGSLRLGRFLLLRG